MLQAAKLHLGLAELLLEAAQQVPRVLQCLQPPLGLPDLLVDLLDTPRHAVAVVVSLEVHQRVLELRLTLPQFAEGRLDRPPLVGDFSELLAQRMLALAELFQPLVQIDALVAASLKRGALLGVGEALIERGYRCHRLALLETFARAIEAALCFVDLCRRLEYAVEIGLETLDRLVSLRE